MKKIDFHIHTNITDGNMPISKVMQLAQQMGMCEIAFTEHISKTPSYDWREFRKNVTASIPSNLNVLIGVETKVLNEQGELNIDPLILNAADIVLGAVHGKGDVVWLLNSPCHIIAHPLITDENVHHFEGCKKILEINPKKKYRLSYHIIQRLVDTGVRFSFGSNTHVPGDMEMGQRYLETIRARFPKIHIVNASEIQNISLG